jgi:hypothetical protein
LLVAAAYLLAAPEFAGEDNIDVSQWSAAMFAPYAVLAGLAGSVLVAAIGPPLTPAEKAERAERAAQRRAENAERAAQRSAERAAAREEKRRAAEEAKRRADEAKRTPSAGEPQQLPGPEQHTDDDLADWPSTLDREPSNVSTAKGTAPGPASPGLRSAGSEATGATREGGAAEGPGARASGASASGRAPVRGPDDGLDEDAYAPARAYRTGGSGPSDARAYASDTVDPEENAPGDRPATGRAEPKTPLWPTKNEGEDPKPPRPRRR